MDTSILKHNQNVPKNAYTKDDRLLSLGLMAIAESINNLAEAIKSPEIKVEVTNKAWTPSMPPKR